MKHSDPHTKLPKPNSSDVKRMKLEGEKVKRTRRGSVIPEPLSTPYPYIATAFFTVIFVNTPLNPYIATGFNRGFKTRKCNLKLNAILMRFRSKRARTNKPNVERKVHQK